MDDSHSVFRNTESRLTLTNIFMRIRTEESRKQQRSYQARKYVEFRAKVDAIKLSSGCVDCAPGTVWHPAALEFDHVDPSTKSFKIAAGSSRKWETVLAEIAKCVVRCANHHVIKTVMMGECGADKK
ncbi:Uncharacterised protein [uncultured archaeon]|nr:Uncharacterised protein [uncultured archaeon]